MTPFQIRIKGTTPTDPKIEREPRLSPHSQNSLVVQTGQTELRPEIQHHRSVLRWLPALPDTSNGPPLAHMDGES